MYVLQWYFQTVASVYNVQTTVFYGQGISRSFDA